MSSKNKYVQFEKICDAMGRYIGNFYPSLDMFEVHRGTKREWYSNKLSIPVTLTQFRFAKLANAQYICVVETNTGDRYFTRFYNIATRVKYNKYKLEEYQMKLDYWSIVINPKRELSPILYRDEVIKKYSQYTKFRNQLNRKQHSMVEHLTKARFKWYQV
jgi:hypothetical protein